MQILRSQHKNLFCYNNNKMLISVVNYKLTIKINIYNDIGTTKSIYYTIEKTKLSFFLSGSQCLEPADLEDHSFEVPWTP